MSWSKRTSRITNPDGSVVFEMNDAEIPATWSQLATDIMVSKYFRKAGVPQPDADGNPLLDEHGDAGAPARRNRPSRSSTAWPAAGATGARSTATSTPPRTPRRSTTSCAYMLVHQMSAPNSPQWFNTGLNFAYGITGPAQGHYYVDPADRRAARQRQTPTPTRSRTPASSSRSHDDLVGEGGIMDLWVREARLFKYGSGTGTNFSKLRGEGEPLSGGGTSPPA